MLSVPNFASKGNVWLLAKRMCVSDGHRQAHDACEAGLMEASERAFMDAQTCMDTA